VDYCHWEGDTFVVESSGFNGKGRDAGHFVGK